MLSEEKLLRMEQASSQKRHWVRLTGACNNRCIFCLDKDTENPHFLPVESIFEDLRKGIAAGCERAILSGGEATLHPGYFDIIRFARYLGYKRIQTVSNGRMFAYKNFLEKAVDAGLQEITFSMHGHTPDLHDAQTRIPGSFKQALAGLLNALNNGKLIVNIDIVINRHNFKLIDEIMDYFINLGVHEFDLLHVTPYGDAWENREKVFYNPATALPHLNRAFAYSRREDLFVWTNRFPPEFLTEFPELIQNPIKIMDEVRGRLDLFDSYLNRGQELPCRGERCQHCFLKGLCDELRQTVSVFKNGNPENIRAHVSELSSIDPRMLKTAHHLWLRGEHAEQLSESAHHTNDDSALLLDFQDWSNAKEALRALTGKSIVAIASDACGIEALLPLKNIEVWIDLNMETLPLIVSFSSATFAQRVKLFSRNRTTAKQFIESVEDLASVFSRKKLRRARTVNIPGCLIDTPPERIPWHFDLSVLDASGGISMYNLTAVFIEHRYTVFPMECQGCGILPECPGVHVNYLRAFGFTPKPVIARKRPEKK
jgi:MoaA/NifB/PqqE/SkfB family radical SAM enzyme